MNISKSITSALKTLSNLFFVFSVVCSTQLHAQELRSFQQTIPGSTVTFKMVPIPSGSFLIGSSETDKLRQEDEGPQKKITLSAFWIAEHEVTFEEWDAFFKNMDVPQTKAVPVD